MPSIAPSFTVVNPSFIEPGIILPYSQASGAFDLLGGGKPLVRLADGDLYVYAKRLDIRTRVGAGQSAYNQLPSVSTMFGQISTPTYLLRVRAEYDHHDTAAVGRWGASITAIQRLGMRQGHFQLARNALLYGMQPANGEGILNTPGATAISLPADPAGNTTVQTYDNGAMGQFIITQIGQLKARTNQLGVPHKITILGPQRTLGTFEWNVVQLTQFQRAGAGTDSTAGLIKGVAAMNNDNIVWVYDDTLIGKGAGGTDAVIISLPEVKQSHVSEIDTNEFARLEPGINACALMYADMAAPKEIPSPMAGGATDVLSEWRITSGWQIRPEAVTIISMQF
jgi:hypothetical protein